MNLSLLLELSCVYLCYPPLWMGLDLLSIFVLTRYIFMVFSPEEDPDFVVEDVE